MKTPLHTLVPLLVFIVTGCSVDTSPENGQQKCAAATQKCTSGYYCSADGFCWKDGTGPEFDGSRAADALMADEPLDAAAQSVVDAFNPPGKADADNCSECEVPANSSLVCKTASQPPLCQSECLMGFADCNKDVAKDGCEINITKDSDNCGVCGHSCLGGDCLEGQCKPVTFALLEDAPGDVEMDEGYVFWSEPKRGLIRRKAKEGGAAKDLISGLDKPATLVVFEDTIFFTQGSAGNPMSGLFRARTDGTSVSTSPLAKDANQDLAVAGNNIFFLGPISGLNREVWFIDKSGGTIRKTGVVGRSLYSDGTTIYVPEPPTGLSGYVFNRITAQGVSSLIIEGSHLTYGVAADETNIYWTTVDSEIRFAAASGRLPSQRLTKIVGTAYFDFKILAEQLFWISRTQALESCLCSVSKKGGEVTTLLTADSKQALSGLLVDSKFIFFSLDKEEVDGAHTHSLMRLAR